MKLSTSSRHYPLRTRRAEAVLLLLSVPQQFPKEPAADTFEWLTNSKSGRAASGPPGEVKRWIEMNHYLRDGIVPVSRR
jgi:hypothetical protein